MRRNIEVFVERAKQKSIYRVYLQWPDAGTITREISFDPPIEDRFKQSQAFDPFELGFEPIGLDKYIGGSSHVDLFLPDDPIACVDWEKLARGRIFRRTPRDYRFRRVPITGRLRIGFVSTIPMKPDAHTEFAAALTDSIEPGQVDVEVIEIKEWENLKREMSDQRFHAMHVLVETAITEKGPQAVIGDLNLTSNLSKRILRSS